MEEKEYTEVEKNALHDLKKLKDLLKQNNDNYIYLGLLLREAKNFYMNIPNTVYKDIYEFAKTELDLCKTTVKYLTGVNQRFANGMNLKPKYENFKYSQLREMLSLSDIQLELVNPEMTVEEIKALKKVKNVDEDVVLKNLINTDNIEYETVQFRNNQDRESFLRKYAEWEKFQNIPELTLAFYRAKLTDDTYVIATEYEWINYYGKLEKCVMYDLFNPADKKSRYTPVNRGLTAIIDYIRTGKLGYLKLVQHD